jgi:hypothetical protein
MSERVPAELWDNIFNHACVDGGRTGCALSLTSRRFRELSAGIRLRSVFISDLEGLKLLLHALERLPEHERRVRFLFIAVRPLDSDATYTLLSLQAAMSFMREESHNLQSFAMSVSGIDTRQVVDAVEEWRVVYPTFLACVAPYVEVLTVHVPYLHVGVVLPSTIHFPVLRDLTLGHEMSTAQLSSLPLLSRLHTFDHGVRTTHGITTTAVHHVMRTQSLDHVHFSGTGAVENVTRALGFLSTPFLPRSLVAASPKLVIGPSRGTTGVPFSNYARRRYNESRDSLLQLYGHERFYDMIVLPPRGGEYSLDLAAKDWRDVVEHGGEGVWGAVETLSE